MAKKKAATTKKSKPSGKSAPSSTDAAEQKRKIDRQIARADQELLSLANERAALVQQLAASGSHDVNARAGSRDATAIDELIAKNSGPLSDACVRAMFRELSSGSRALARATQVGFLGPLGSFSHEAAVARFGDQCEMVPLGTIAAVFDEVAGQQIDFGLVPLENSTDGRIADTIPMFTKVRVRIAGEVQLRIHHQLLGKGPRTNVTTICSKPQALSQCRGWLVEHFPSAKTIETASTTSAAEMATHDRTIAAIASRQAATKYELDILAADIEDNRHNVTRFAVLGQTAGEKSGNDKTALWFRLPHQPGALADVLAVFKKNRLNLTWIESFPLPERHNEYFFFAELQGHETELRARRAFAALAKKTDSLEILGSYMATKIGT